MDKIYDESGLVIGEARPIVERTDIDLSMPDILDPEVLPTSGIIVVEHKRVSARNDFVLEYIMRREIGNVSLRDCWQ